MANFGLRTRANYLVRLNGENNLYVVFRFKMRFLTENAHENIVTTLEEAQVKGFRT